MSQNVIEDGKYLFVTMPVILGRIICGVCIY